MNAAQARNAHRRSRKKLKADFGAFARKIDVDVKTVMRVVSLRVFSKIVKRTPVDSGTARASWMISINSIAPEITVTLSKAKGVNSKSAATSIAMRQNAKLRQLTGYDVVCISNNTPYIRKLEYGGYPNPPKKGSIDIRTKKFRKKTTGGFSIQAPRGMARISLEEMNAEIIAILRAA